MHVKMSRCFLYFLNTFIAKKYNNIFNNTFNFLIFDICDQDYYVYKT